MTAVLSCFFEICCSSGECLFKAVILFLGILASILAAMVLTLLVILLSRMSSNASENESFSICGIVPYQGLNPWTVQVVTQNGSAGKICGGSFRLIDHVTSSIFVQEFYTTNSMYYNYMSPPLQ